MCYTLFSDVIPAADRTLVFYQLNAVLRIVSVAASPLAAFLLSVDPWIAVWIGLGLLLLGTGCTLLIPETLEFRKAADQKRASCDHHSSSAATTTTNFNVFFFKSAFQHALSSAQADFTHIWRFLLGSKNIMLLMTCNALVFPLRLAFDGDLLQYMTKRYDWSWSMVSVIIAACSVTSRY